MIARVLIAFLLSLMQIACVANTVGTSSYRGEITRIHDGDSVHITPDNGQRIVVRLAAIDAPELQQPFGMESRDFLRKFALNQQAVARCSKTDRYNRRVCSLYVDGEDAGLKMLKSGYAWHYKRFEDEQNSRERRTYARAESSAQNRRIGLWAAQAEAPWDFRARP